MNGKVILGFSGGIDSTVSARILQSVGWNVHLETIDTIGDNVFLSEARNSADRLALPLHITDATVSFRSRIIDYFMDSYLNGETPAPCTVCNVEIKWKTLYERMQAERADHIATGHYFRIYKEDGHYFVRKALDSCKDQSYYLWDLPQAYLARALTPMGNQIKEEVRTQYAGNVPERESMGVCFLKGCKYTDYLLNHTSKILPGTIVDQQGNTVGRHLGCALYTIGQKKGYECSVPSAVVTGIDAPHNQLIVGHDKDLYYHNLVLAQYRIADWDRLLNSQNITIKIRGLGRNPELPVKVISAYPSDKSRNPEMPVKVTSAPSADNGRNPNQPVNIPRRSGGSSTVEIPRTDILQIYTPDPAWAPAKGQPVVFYEDELVIGGGYLIEYF